MAPVYTMAVCFVVDEYDGITVFAYNKLCLNLLICWAIPSSQVEFCENQKQFLFLSFIMDLNVAPCWWFSVGFFHFRIVWLHALFVQQYMGELFLFFGGFP